MFDNGAILQCYSNNLHVELPTASLPPDPPPPHRADNPVGCPPQAQAWLDAEEEDIQEATQNMEEEEHLPQEPLEHDEHEGGNSRGGMMRTMGRVG